MDTVTLPDAPFRLTGLADLGISPKQLRHLVDDGEVRRLLRGVYLRADVEPTTLVRAHAVSLAVAGHHVACDRTAAWIHGIDVMTAGDEAPPAIETCTLPGRTATERRDVDGHIRDLESADIMVIHGLRVTTPLRTALDLGCVLRRREAYAALNDFARRHGLTREQLLVEVRRRYGRRRGVRQLRALVPLIEPRVESPRESWTLLEIHDAGLPLPEPQVWIDVGGMPTYRLDFAYRRRRVAIEYDGRDWHDLTDEQRRHDEARRDWLRDHGWTVIVIRSGAFTGTALDRWIDRLAQALQPTYSNRRW
ncbi:type IV toxin-antitoxin system AbiEi family antitoxin domain-containing protein [Nocardioides sp. CER19]|uniref:type IV toxin-antitoxin system AbiEi family antitoxin domain-containing protein n=1 Tax=Nocardioides sp. CER19 TaxID=3038538 RepID=UPI002446EE30|nr:type IV toxin-antitoxin system AbiEi family antitoxin domain-containing protein [Nocardioides sp. CER19]MDH2416731.1 type IV toxin-antitoxin system AbiEi family antitoxin domain-containing protein [Nocardioides sp. CER19]